MEDVDHSMGLGGHLGEKLAWVWVLVDFGLKCYWLV